MEPSSVNIILILLIVSVAMVAIFRRFNMPSVLAYLLSGVIVGPYGLEWVAHTDNTHFLAEFGVVFLLFTIGLEFSIAKIVSLKKEVIGLGGAQILFTVSIAVLFALLFDLPVLEAIIIGGIIAMSSTAIVTKLLNDQKEMKSKHGKLSVAILLAQDIAVVPFLILIVVLAGNQQNTLLFELSWAMLKAVLVITAMLLAGWWILRPLFAKIVAVHSSELFTLTSLLFAIAAAWLSHYSGLSFALGAFLAGMVLGETEFRYQLEADIRPFRDVLLGLFFLTMGMMLNLGVLVNNIIWISLLVAGLILFKWVTVMLLSLIFKASVNESIRTGLLLAQGGEFGMALLALALTNDLLPDDHAQLILASLIISMTLSSVLIKHNERISRLIWHVSGSNPQPLPLHLTDLDDKPSNHAIIAGFGSLGLALGRLLHQQGFEYIGIDQNVSKICTEQGCNNQVYYGDASQLSILESANLSDAKVLAITFCDCEIIEKTIMTVRGKYPDIPILAWANEQADTAHILNIGATDVIPRHMEENLIFETHLLRLMQAPLDEIVKRIQSACSEHFSQYVDKNNRFTN